MPSRAAILEDLASKPNIDEGDVIAARQALFDDAAISKDEAEALFRINDQARSACPAWRMLFVEALTDYLVRQQQPTGYVDREKAQWLIDQVSGDGRIKTQTELELLLHVLEQAYEAPRVLARFAFEQVVAHALSERRRDGGGAALTADEVSRIRRALYSFAGAGGGAAVSREEAMALFELNEASRGQDNDPSWTELFSKAIGAALMGATGYRPPSREEAQRREAWLVAPTEGVASILAKTFGAAIRTGLGAGIAASKEPDPYERRYAALVADEAACAPVDGGDARWLIAMIGRDGQLDENETALLWFIKREAEAIHPALQPLLDRLGSEPDLTEAAPAKAAFGRRA